MGMGRTQIKTLYTWKSFTLMAMATHVFSFFHFLLWTESYFRMWVKCETYVHGCSIFVASNITMLYRLQLWQRREGSLLKRSNPPLPSPDHPKFTQIRRSDRFIRDFVCVFIAPTCLRASLFSRVCLLRRRKNWPRRRKPSRHRPWAMCQGKFYRKVLKGNRRINGGETGIFFWISLPKIQRTSILRGWPSFLWVKSSQILQNMGHLGSK